MGMSRKGEDRSGSMEVDRTDHEKRRDGSQGTSGRFSLHVLSHHHVMDEWLVRIRISWALVLLWTDSFERCHHICALLVDHSTHA